MSETEETTSPTADDVAAQKRRIVRIIITLVVLWTVACVVGVVIGSLLRPAAAPETLNAFAPPHDLAKRAVPEAGTAGDILAGAFGNVTRAAETAESALDGVNIAPALVATGTYTLPDGAMVTVTAAQMASADEALNVLRALKDAASAGGSLGNFVIGLEEVSYVIYRIQETTSLAWAHGAWVFVASGAQSAHVDQFVQAFPY